MAGFQHCAAVEDTSSIGAARRSVQRLAESLDEADETLTERVGIVATELAANIARHAGRGELLSRELDGPRRGIEIVALDRGGGIADIDRALQDGYSTSGAAGNGLGSVRRFSDEFDLFSEVGRGTVVLSRIYPDPTPSPLGWRWGIAESCAPGEELCGDGWWVEADDTRIQVLAVDGLGHGPLAHAAARLAIESFRSRLELAPKEQLVEADKALRSSRGAAMAVARAAAGQRTLRYAGVGNISGTLVAPDGSQRALVSFNGTVGAELHTVRQLEYEWDVGARLVMHSDGIQSRWALRDRPGLIHHHPSVIAAVLYRDHRRGRDDATVIVVERLG